ncbi:MAG: immunoglobulin domain-containing protein [Verrucomicrobia bacterium]|nr:immunoglobulin domain-containing protein [Verrucomicrobiota bacterium]
MLSLIYDLMTSGFRTGRPAFLLVLLASALPALAQPTVTGVADRSVNTDAATFTVVTQAGYSYAATLNGNPVSVGVPVTVTRMDYYDLWAWRTNLSEPFEVTSRLVRFIVRSSERGSPEQGLMKWTPYPLISSTAAEFAGAVLHVTAPMDYPPGLPIPIVVRVDDGQDRERRVNGWVTAPGFEGSDVKLMRGHGSGFLPSATNAGTLSYAARIQSLSAPRQIHIDQNPVWTTVGAGVLSGNVTWPENSRIHLSGSVVVPAGSTLTVGAGTIVKLNPLVNITNNGTVQIQGTANRPVVFTATNVVWPERNAGAWGGFVMRLGNAVLEANHAILAGGGGGTGWNFSPGSSHKSQQPVLFIWSNSVARLTNCAILNSAGQMGNGYRSDLILDHTLWQRAITGGEYVGGTIIVNHSAIIEFPADDGVVDAAIADADYDGIYFTEGTHILMNSLFGFAKDDAIDSGSGGAGTVWLTNCWVESALHEAHAWSGSGRVASSYDIVLMNSGQGLECGWSSSDGSPDVFAERMLSTGNSVGARFGDNYDWDYWGTLRVTNSLILNNYRDIWGLNWDNWLYGIYTPTGPFRMDLQGNFVTQPNTNHPNNTLWEPVAEGWRLAHWMTTPPDAPVGIGLAVRTNRLKLADLTNGVPVRLSSFTTHFVSVDYLVSGTNGPVASGTVEFAPGETVKTIPPLWPATNEPVLQVALQNPVRGEITTLPQAWYFKPVQSTANPVPFITRGSRWSYLDTGGNPGTAWRNLGYDDSSWSNNLAELGFGDSDERTPIRRYGTNGVQTITYYFRQTFTVTDPAAFGTLSMWLRRDDGGVVYLNGQDVFRSVNLPPAPATITSQTLANYNGAGTAENAIDLATLSAASLVAGTNLLAVEIHQHDTGSSDASFDFALTGIVATATSPPIIQRSPTNQTVLLGGTATFSVEATGGTPLEYEWWHNPTRRLVPAIGPVLTLTNVTGADAGEYHVVVLNTDGSATSQSATLFVPDADSDGDTMSNGWETDHGLDPFFNDANLDADGDGVANLAEFLAGTDPQDRASYLKIDTIAPPAAASGAVALTFEAVAGKSYSLRFAEELPLPATSWLTVTSVVAEASNRVITVQDPSATNSARRYYRLQTPAAP